ncbi:MAG: hypothetical protein OXH75_07725 [Acidobacteria bacterium]|nr:hypothetical protein [Acidobacteriota bacterium]
MNRRRLAIEAARDHGDHTQDVDERALREGTEDEPACTSCEGTGEIDVDDPKSGCNGWKTVACPDCQDVDDEPDGEPDDDWPGYDAVYGARYCEHYPPNWRH